MSPKKRLEMPHECHYILKFEGNHMYILCADCDKIKFEKDLTSLERSRLEELLKEKLKELGANIETDTK